MSAGGHHQDCRDRHFRVAAPAATHVLALAASFESEFRDRCRVIYQLDSHKVQI
jgi:hypothetical protein